ncbi:tetratricopeptide repeat protein [Roseovarius sp. MS2]|uniref:tetratricopeptide repeat protein n=1 Tax=Roseovarius sp. MS2 TaxID=3390728 RepID=UPI003EDBDA6C
MRIGYFTRFLAPVGLAVVLSGCAALEGTFQVSSASSDGDEAVEVAQAVYSGGAYQEAARLFERAAQTQPDSAEAYLGLGRAYMALDQTSRAELAFTRARTLDKRNPEVLIELGHLEVLRLHPERAITHYDRALDIDRRNLSALTGKGVALDFLSRHDEANAVYRSAVGLYPTNFILLNNYALNLVLSGQIGAGLTIMQDLMRDPENDELVRSNMALALVLDSRMNDARALLEGSMSTIEIDATVRKYMRIREQFLAGKPVGYMLFN